MLIQLLHSMPTSQNIWVGFSGGLDSTALLHTLKNQSENNFQLHAIHIHHGLNKLADEWALHCQTLCQQWQIPLHVVRVNLEDKDRNTEHKAREARFNAFQNILAPGDTLALAHHQDDVAETLLLRLMRGSGTQALANMQILSQRDHYSIWRPLLHCTRADLEQYAEQHKLHWIEDDSNSDSRFDRNFIRHEILPRLEQRFPNAKKGIAQSAKLLATDAELLETQIEINLAFCKIDEQLNVSKILSITTGMQAHVLRAWILNAGKATPTARAIAVFLQEISEHQSDDNLCMAFADYQIYVWLDNLYLLTSPEVAYEENVETLYWDGLSPIKLPRGGSLSWQGRSPLITQVKYRRGGEKIQLNGRTIHHAVKKLLSQSIPPWQRDSLPFVYNEQGELLAVGNQLISETLHQHQIQHATHLQWNSEDNK
jgi:tRNA(Ile)-lysidine synthase